MKLLLTKSPGIQTLPFVKRQIKRAIQAVLDAEQVRIRCQVSVWLTDDTNIQQINASQRHIDQATDVLSFPMFDLTAGAFDPAQVETDPGSGRVHLGDMVLSMEHVYKQADAYGHSARRELAYLCVHSTLHLLGYDHMDEGEEKARMRAREEFVLDKLGLKR